MSASKEDIIIIIIKGKKWIQIGDEEDHRWQGSCSAHRKRKFVEQVRIVKLPLSLCRKVNTEIEHF